MLGVEFRVENRIAWIKISLNIGLWSEELARDGGRLGLIPAAIWNGFQACNSNRRTIHRAEEKTTLAMLLRKAKMSKV